MSQKMTWETIKKKYPNEWVLVVDYEFTDTGEIKRGILVTHSQDKDEVFSYPAVADKVGLWYTGTGNYRGHRSNVHPH